ncbi:type II secretion system F family protein [Stappia taiwanensis]|uniref:Type II secretion system F family protein n=1 Tax=Stappia taiwanensis TaxID=992267 RepID=A0A838XQL1_9HYPH|nr:type II secretion system F family protein [Stappia taiwanensis]MBA4612765.1 type II secretion system F family protein [Stappia taiwanensis]GGE90231.1 type II secretion system protein [Stappia taiwanensis]
MALNISDLANQQTIIAGLTMIAVAGTVFTLVMPLFEGDKLKSRMKSVALEREQMRARERTRLANEKSSARASLRNQPKQQLQRLVDQLNLKALMSDENTRLRLLQAGFRGTKPLYTFLAVRLVMPFLLLLATLFYLFAVIGYEGSATIAVTIACAAAFLGYYVPDIYLRNSIQKRQLSISRAWPDALDLMLICVESGMSIEVAFHKVADEIGVQSVALAEELTLTNAELSFLGERRVAYENLARRTGLEGVKNVCLALIQAERYGTPVSQALRVMADENRSQRMQAAEKKAAALPPKLTVPMIVFFLPVLLAVIIGPVILQVLATFK